MAEAEQIKVCPLCAETIKAAAKVCPYCRKSQRRWLFLSANDLVAAFSLLFFLTSGLLAVIFFHVGHGRTFSPKTDRIEVLNSQLALERGEFSTNSTNLVIFGVLSNSTPYTWTISRLEVRFFNQERKTIDTDEFYGDFTILPNSDHSFRSALSERHIIPDYESYKIRVSYAYDPKAWPQF